MNCRNCGSTIPKENREDIDDQDPRGYRDIGAIYYCPFCGWEARYTPFGKPRDRWHIISEGAVWNARVERWRTDNCGSRPPTSDETEWWTHGAGGCGSLGSD